MSNDWIKIYKTKPKTHPPLELPVFLVEKGGDPFIGGLTICGVPKKCWWKADGWAFKKKPGGKWVAYGTEDHDIRPTHWMRLPERPQ